MLDRGNTYIVLSRTSGNPDGIVHPILLTAGSDLTIGNHTKNINLDSLNLVSGTTYKIQVIGQDIAGNRGVSSAASITYDNQGPSAPRPITIPLYGTTTPTLSWIASIDNFGNGAGVKQYTLRVYNGKDCSSAAIQTQDTIPGSVASAILSALPNARAEYSWTVTPIDHLDTIGAISRCATFKTDTTVPVISAVAVKDTVLNSVTYTKDGDDLTITATIPNTDADHLWLDASALATGPSYADMLCSAPAAGVTCSYASNQVTYSFRAGFAGSTGNGSRQITLRAQNISGGNEQTAVSAITADNASPVVSGNTIVSPNGGEFLNGTTRTITWNPANITDSIGIKSVTLEYATGAGVWNAITTGANNGSFVWNISGLADGNDYHLRIIASDFVGHTASDISDADFAIDHTAPVMTSNIFTAPAANQIFAGGQQTSITWNAA